MLIKYLFQESLKNIFRNKSSFFLSAGVSAACLILLSIFLVLTLNISRVKNYIEERVEIYAFLNDDADVNNLVDKIGQINGVKQIKYVSKEEALQELRSDLQDNSSLLDILQRNPLPASLRIQLDASYKVASKLSDIESKVQILKGIKETWSGKELLDKLQHYLKTITVFDIGILLITFISVIFIISRTVEAAIVGKAREIEIMRLVGASTTMVEFPFYVEGFLHGVFGSILSFIISVILFYFASAEIPSFHLPFFTLLIFNILFGGALGLAGSYIALSRILM
jgi:cell division transport system permease protein